MSPSGCFADMRGSTVVDGATCCTWHGTVQRSHLPRRASSTALNHSALAVFRSETQIASDSRSQPPRAGGQAEKGASSTERRSKAPMRTMQCYKHCARRKAAPWHAHRCRGSPDMSERWRDKGRTVRPRPVSVEINVIACM